MSETSTTLKEAFDTSKEAGTPAFEPLPAGSYVAAITEAKVSALKSGKGQAVLATWEVQGGQHDGRLIFDRIIIQHESEAAMKIGRQKLKDIAVACEIKDAITDLDVLRNKPCLIYVKIEQDEAGEYEPKNKVGRVKPIAKPDKPAANGKPFNDEIGF